MLYCYYVFKRVVHHGVHHIARRVGHVRHHIAHVPHAKLVATLVCTAVASGGLGYGLSPGSPFAPGGVFGPPAAFVAPPLFVPAVDTGIGFIPSGPIVQLPADVSSINNVPDIVNVPETPNTPSQNVPEPASFWLLLTGIGILIARRALLR